MEHSPLRGLWQFPATVTALSLLSEPLSFPPPSPSALEIALHHPAQHPQLLSDLHGRLLGLSLGASAAAKWLTATARFVRANQNHFTHALAACVGCDAEHLAADQQPLRFPTDEDHYARISVVARLLVLHNIAELVIAYHDTLLSAGSFAAYDVDQIRFAPFGTDAVGNAYWYFNDLERVYREPSQRAREKADRLIRSEQLARERESQRQEKAEKRRAAQQKKEEQRRRKEERRRRNAEKWAPRVAASRVTRAARRAKESQMAQAADQSGQQEQPANGPSTRRKPKTESAADEAEQAPSANGSSQRSRPVSSTESIPQADGFDQQDDQPATRGRRGRRRKAQTDQTSQVAPKRPRRTEITFSDPDLRICKDWEVFTTDAASLRDVINRFNKDENLPAMERTLVRGFSEHILPEIEQHEAKRRREMEKRNRAEFLMMNQKRSSRVQAIAERKERAAQKAAQKEEQLRFEEERIAVHNSRIAKSLAFEEKEQSQDIKLARKKYGLAEAVARDEEEILKNEAETKKLIGVQVRRSSRTSKGRNAWKERAEESQDIMEEKPSAVKKEPETVVQTGKSHSEESLDKNMRTDQAWRSEESIEVEPRRNSSSNGFVSKAEKDATKNGVISGSSKSEAVDPSKEHVSLPNPGALLKDVERISSCPLETTIGKAYQWDRNQEDGMPVYVLDKFFFAYRDDFGDAPLEESEYRGAEMFGLGILIPPLESSSQVSRVEIPSIMDWVIEYGSIPKLWVKSKHAWYELRRPAIEYREVFASARRKYELCVRIAILGETMRGTQLEYNSMVKFLSMRYGDMKSYKEAEVLEERFFIMSQMETLNRRSLLQSGFLKSLNKKIREDKRREHLARARVRSQKHKDVTESQGDTKDESDSDIIGCSNLQTVW